MASMAKLKANVRPAIVMGLVARAAPREMASRSPRPLASSQIRPTMKML